MSRIGKKPIEIPAGVTVTVNGSEVTVKGPKVNYLDLLMLILQSIKKRMQLQ